MPANLNNPFGESCCDGGQCGVGQSAMSCGCDPGANHLCEHHLNDRMRGTLEDLLTADETSTLDRMIAVVEYGLNRTGEWEAFSKKYGKTYSIKEINDIKADVHFLLKRINLGYMTDAERAAFDRISYWANATPV